MIVPIWVEEAVVIAIHRRQLAEHGGSDGIRDRGLLESALFRPKNQFAYSSPNIFDLAAVNPGHIKEDIAIALPRPRHIDDTLTPEFMQISRRILATIREETLKSMVSS